MIKSYHLYLAGQEAWLRRETGLWRSQVEDAGHWRWDHGNAASLRLDDMPASPNRHVGLRVYLGSALCRLMVAPCPPGLRGQNERNAVAAAHMANQLGLSAADWCFTATGDASGNRLFLCAMRRSLLACMHELAAQRHLKLLSVRPYAQGIWNMVAAEKAGEDKLHSLIIIEPDALALFNAKGSQLHTMSTLFHSQEPGLVEREINRVKFTSTEAGHEVAVALLCGLDKSKVMPVQEGLLSKALIGPGLFSDFRDLAFMEEAS